MKLKDTRDQYTFDNVWTQDGKIMFKDGNKVKICFDSSMESKLHWFTLMENEIALGIISLIFVLGFYMRFSMDIASNICFLMFLSRMYF